MKAELLFGVVVRAFGLYGMLWGLYECFTGFYVAVAHTSYHQGAVFNFLAFGLFLLIVSYSLIRSASGMVRFCYRGSDDENL